MAGRGFGSGDRVAFMYYLWLFVTVCISCAAGAVLGAWWPGAEHMGQRGGGLGVAIALFAIWLRPKFAAALRLEAVEREMTERGLDPTTRGRKPYALDAKEASDRLHVLYTSLDLGEAYERQSVTWLAVSTMIATLFWTFGDYLSLAIRPILLAMGLGDA